jgi:cation:H+ antiporter
MNYILVAAGLSLLFIGGEALVRGAVALARHLDVSPLIIGLTVIAYGTSAPELLVTLEANLSGAPGIAIGNIVGSNIANILLIIGCSALIYPIACAGGSIKVNGPAVLGATVLLVVLGNSGAITAWAAGPMLALLIAFSVYSYRRARADGPAAALARHEIEEFEDGRMAVTTTVLALVLGLAGVIVGSDLLVSGAVGLARSFGVAETTIGLTLVAFGTSLPELATAVVAAYRRHPDVALGNVVGSNIFNTLGILGIVPFFGPLPVPADLARFDLWVMLGATVVFLAWLGLRGSVGRAVAGVFLFAYGAYIAGHCFGLSAVAMTLP